MDSEDPGSYPEWGGEEEFSGRDCYGFSTSKRLQRDEEMYARYYYDRKRVKRERQWREFLQKVCSSVDGPNPFADPNSPAGDANGQSAPSSTPRTPVSPYLRIRDPQFAGTLKYLVRKGIPHGLRRDLWMEISGASDRMRKRPGYFQELDLRTVEDDTADGLEETLRQIDMDVPRTFPRHPYFQLPRTLSRLSRVLRCFARHNKRIGYCQSMNFVVGFILFVFSGWGTARGVSVEKDAGGSGSNMPKGKGTPDDLESLGDLLRTDSLGDEQAFWLLVTFIEDVFPSEYYTPTMIGVNVDMVVLGDLIQEKLVGVHKALKNHGFEIAVVATQWFLVLFLNTAPTEAVLRIWDCVILEGMKVLFRVSLALLKAKRSELLEAGANENPDYLFRILRELPREVTKVDELMKLAFNGLRNFSRQHIESLRDKEAITMHERFVSRKRLRDRIEQEEKLKSVAGIRDRRDSEKPAVLPCPAPPVFLFNEFSDDIGEDSGEIEIFSLSSEEGDDVVDSEVEGDCSDEEWVDPLSSLVLPAESKSEVAEDVGDPKDTNAASSSEDVRDAPPSVVVSGDPAMAVGGVVQQTSENAADPVVAVQSPDERSGNPITSPFGTFPSSFS